jgi:hypothetical protein
MQSVTKNLALGGELMYQWKKDSETAGITLAARYKTPVWVGTALLSPAGIFNASYCHKFNPKTLVATELNLDLLNEDLNATFGYQYNFTRSSFRAQVSFFSCLAATLNMNVACLTDTMRDPVQHQGAGGSHVGAGALSYHFAHYDGLVGPQVGQDTPRSASHRQQLSAIFFFFSFSIFFFLFLCMVTKKYRHCCCF